MKPKKFGMTKQKWNKLKEMRSQQDRIRKLNGIPVQKKKKIHRRPPRIFYGYNTGK